MRPRVLVPLLMALVTTFGCSQPGSQAPSPTPGEQVVARMIEAHGGLDKWRSAPTVSFEDAFLPAGESSARISRVTVEQSQRRAYLDVPQTGARISWDGEKAWGEKWESRIPPRFVALLSYYFFGLPWLATDPGVLLSEPGTAKLWDDPTEYITVKMSFEPGVGDTPEDYYLLYLDPDTYQLRASDFTVTYAAILPPDVAQIKETIIYQEFASVDGLTVPAKATIYREDKSVAGTFEWRDVSFNNPFDASRMEMPADAVVDTSSPTRAATAPE